VGANAPSDPVVVKIGGRALEGNAGTTELAAGLRALPAPAVVVHGGGAEVSDWSRRLGLVPHFVAGRRVTDPETLEIAVAVLAGLANKRLVAGLRAAGVDAVGLAALDGGVVDAARHADAALGAVGSIERVDPALLETMLAQGRVPVLASIGHAGGALLNLNADDLAAAVARALHARALLLLSDVPGVMLDGALASELTAEAARAALAGDQVQGGMRPKLEAAGAALAAGVRRVHVAAWQGPATLRALLEGATIGTALVAEAVAR
jgi:acetylglutamate kinase